MGTRTADSNRMWGALARLFRIRAGLTYDEFAEHVGYSKSLVVGIEKGTRRPSRSYIISADKCTDAGGWLIQTAEHLTTHAVPSYRLECTEAERSARAMMIYDTHVLHAMLRTECYSRAVLEAHFPALSEKELEERLGTEFCRQQMFLRQSGRVVSFVIEEFVLSRHVGGRESMKKQLDYLATLSERPNVTIQVMPRSACAHPGLGGPMVLLQLPDHSWTASLEVQELTHPLDDQEKVSVLQYRYIAMCGYALSPEESTLFIRRLADEL